MTPIWQHGVRWSAAIPADAKPPSIRGTESIKGFYRSETFSYSLPSTMVFLSLLIICGSLALSGAAPSARNIQTRQDTGNTAFVHLSNNTGSPTHLASGILYGIPDAANQIPDHFYTDINFRYTRVGGSQYGAPRRGWIWGANEYEVDPFSQEMDLADDSRAASLPC